MTVATGELFILSNRRNEEVEFPTVQYLCNETEIEAAIEATIVHRPRKRSRWIVKQLGLLNELIKIATYHREVLDGLLLLKKPRVQALPALNACFSHVFAPTDFRFVPTSELLEILTAENSSDLLIGGTVDQRSETLTLVRGNFEPLVVPLSIFKSTPAGVEPDFSRLKIIDLGQAVQFGDYESSADAILYEVDPEYRRRLKKRRQAEEAQP